MSNNIKFNAPAIDVNAKIGGFIGRKLKASDFSTGDINGRHQASQKKPFAVYYCMTEASTWQANINVRNLPSLPSRASFESNGFFWPLSCGDAGLKVSAERYEVNKSFVHIANGFVAWLAANVDKTFVAVDLFANLESDDCKAFRGFVQAFAGKDTKCHKSFRLPAEFGKNDASYAMLDVVRDLVACSAIIEPVFDDGTKERRSVNIKTKYRVSAAWRETLAVLNTHYQAYLA
jgi:hypothetical protein